MAEPMSAERFLDRWQNYRQQPQQGAAVLVCNHMSFVDWMVIAAGVRRPVRFIMDHSFAKGPVTRFVLKQAKVILIASAKENPGLLRSAFEKAADPRYSTT
jgi:1-acyl-sn-glycerol-3-phosphate acyltransferase